jgi:tape measure domain-containing protein
MAGLKVKIGADASQFERTMRGVKKQVGGVRKSIMGIGGAVGAIWAVNKAFGAMKSAARLVTNELKATSEVAADVEMMETQFEVLTASQSKAAELMGVFREEAQKSSLTLQDWASSARTLLAFGTDADEVTGAMKMLGDVSMGNSEQFKNMTLAYAQVAAAGRLMGQEVRQMVNAGFNPLQQISEKTGESMMDLKKRMEEGLIPFSEVEQAFVDATSKGGRFYKAIDKGSDTFVGKMNKTKDSIFGLRLAFGEGMNEGLKDVLDATSDFLPQFQEQLTKAGKNIGTAISEAVEGDSTKLEAIGRYIGSFIAEGIERTVTEAMRIFLAKGTGFGAVLDKMGVDTSFGMLKTGKDIGKEWQQKRQTLGTSIQTSTQVGEALAPKAPGSSFFSRMGELVNFVNQERQNLGGMSADPFEGLSREAQLLQKIERHLAGNPLTN